MPRLRQCRRSALFPFPWPLLPLRRLPCASPLSLRPRCPRVSLWLLCNRLLSRWCRPHRNRSKNRLDHVQPFLGREQRLFARMDPDGDNQPVAQAHGMPDDIEVAVGDGVERAGIQGNAGHKPVYPAPGSPASGWFQPKPSTANLLFLNPFRTMTGVSASPVRAGDCFIPGWATKQISGGTKPYSALAKTSGNGRWLSGG